MMFRLTLARVDIKKFKHAASKIGREKILKRKIVNSEQMMMMRRRK
jgi:hypothetical protein